ncbi:MAG TPA: hypothetical protein VME92_09710 [Acetobacteraceae bacterium]|nr:hypothetical protein [Acetobacteraceae bacterium]
METARMIATPRQWVELEVVARAMGLTPEQVKRRAAEGKLPRPSFHLGYTRPVWNRELLIAMLPEQAVERLEAVEHVEKRKRPPPMPQSPE